MPCRFASSGTVATSRSASRAILALNAASNFLRDLVISVLHRLRQSRTLHTLTFGPISGVHFTKRPSQTLLCGGNPMEHRGVEYSVVQLPEGNRWRWEVRFGDGKTKTGVTPVSRAVAIKQAKSAIDHFLRDTK